MILEEGISLLLLCGETVVFKGYLKEINNSLHVPVNDRSWCWYLYIWGIHSYSDNHLLLIIISDFVPNIAGFHNTVSATLPARIKQKSLTKLMKKQEILHYFTILR